MKPEMDGERVKLRQLKLSDAQDIYENLQDKEMVRWALNIPWPYKKQDAIRWIRRTRDKIRNKKEYGFGIVLKAKNKVIGAVSLMHIDWKNKNGELGYWVGNKYWGKGYATEAVKLVLEFAFEKLKLHRIYANIFEENVASRRVLEKSGFKLEGITRECRHRHGKWHNELRFGILNQEFEKFKKHPTRTSKFPHFGTGPAFC